MGCEQAVEVKEDVKTKSRCTSPHQLRRLSWYACAFGAMIDAWRAAWASPQLPFVFVQISAWFGNWGFDQLPCTYDYCPVISRIRLAPCRRTLHRRHEPPAADVSCQQGSRG